MCLEKAIRAVLIADEGVNALVASRIYPQRRPMGTDLPALIYQNVLSHQVESLDAQGVIRRTRLAIECLDNTYGDTKTLRDAVEAALNDYAGTEEDETIHSTRLESAVDIDEELEPAGSFGVFRTIMDYVIWHQ